MPVTKNTSNLFNDDQLGEATVDPLIRAGRPLMATGKVANAADDLATSKYKLVTLPSACLLHEDTKFDVDGWGLAQVSVGTFDDADALFSVATSANAVVQPIAFGDANYDLRLWEILGMAEDPGGFITLYAHAVADATAAGELKFQVVSIQNN